MRKRRRTIDDRDAIAGVTRNRLCREIAKDRNVDRDLVEKNSKATADGRPVVAGRSKDKTVGNT